MLACLIFPIRATRSAGKGGRWQKGGNEAGTALKLGISSRLAQGRARALLAGIILVAAVACTPIIRDHGYVPAPDELAKVSVGDTREDVTAKVGRPSTSGLLNDDGWFYVQSRWETRGAKAPVEIDRQVVSISFDQSGRVANVEHFGLERGRVVALSRRVTESSIRGVSFLGQLFSNLGRFSAEQLLNDD